MRDYVKSYFTPFILYLFLSIFSLRSLFLDSNPVAFHDLSPIFRPEQLSRPFEIPWDHKSNLGTPNMLTGNAVYNSLLYLFFAISGSVILGHKLLLVFLTAISGFGFYLFFSHLLRSKIASFLAGIHSIFNVYLYVRWHNGHNTLILAYAILPFALLLFFREKPLSSLIGGLLSSLILASNPHTAYLEFILVLLYSIFRFKEGIKKGLYAIVSTLIFILAAIVPNIPFLYLVYKIDLPVYSVRAEEAFVYIYIDEILPILPAVAFSIFVIWAALSFKPISIKAAEEFSTSSHEPSKNHDFHLKFFLLLSVIGGIMTVLPVTPLSFIYRWLFQNVPGFAMFRESTKFLLFFSISASYFTGFVGERIVVRNLKKARLAALFFFILLIFSSSWPFLTGDIGGNVGTVDVPQDYEELYERLQSDRLDYRIAFLPPASWATTYSWAPRWFLDPIISLQAKPTLEIKGEMDQTDGAKLARWIYTKIYTDKDRNWCYLLGLANVKYVFLREDANVLEFRGDMKRFNSNNTKCLPLDKGCLKFIDKLGSIAIYENPLTLPHLYLAENYGVIVGDRDALLFLTNKSKISIPLVFLDDLKDVEDLWSSDLIVIHGNNSVLDLISFYANGRTLNPWKYAPLSSDMVNKWVRGELTWYMENGEPFSAPSGFIFTIGRNSIDIRFNVDKEGLYVFFVKAYMNSTSSNGAIFEINDKAFRISPRSSSSYQWYELGSVKLRKGENVMRIENLGGPIAISKILFLTPNEVKMYKEKVKADLSGYKGTVLTLNRKGVKSEALNLLSTYNELSYERVSSSKYIVEVDRPGYLVFLESGSDYWILRGNGTEVKPIKAFNYASMFKVDKPGMYELIFLGEEYLREGILLAVLISVAPLSTFFLLRRLEKQR